ncbi:recombinase family protein [Phenylobacterium ferrooxidans]|uniref:Recombinase family protein n=1 Tax=Phenylobacterium ferrooxidans TaxID=2982689 RepID=A0ABW6CLX2_9CAUL
MARAYSYIRFSHPGQVEGDSLRRQLEASERYAAEHGLELVKSYQDLGTSAFKGAHRKGSLGLFLKAVEAGEVPRGSVFLVENCDRLSREDPLEALDLFRSITKSGITIVTTDDGHAYSTESMANNPMQLMMWIMGAIRGNGESQRKAEVLRKSWAEKRRKARTELKPISRMCPRWLTLANGAYEPIPDRVEVVKRIFNELESGVGVHKLAQRLNQERIPPFAHGDGWQHSILLQIAHNRAVLGDFQPHTKVSGKREPDGPPIQNYFPYVISEQQFYRVQAALLRRRFNAPGRKGKGFSNLFTGLAKCESCGGSMTYRDRGERSGGATLVCARALRKQQCSNDLRYNYREIELSILSIIPNVRLHPSVDTSGVDDDVSEKRKERDELTDRIRRLADLIETGSSTLVQRLLSAEQDLKDLDREISRQQDANMRRLSEFSATDEQLRLVDFLNKEPSQSSEKTYAARASISEVLRILVDELEFGASEQGDYPIVKMQLLAGGLIFYLDGLSGERFPLRSNYLDWIGPVDEGGFIETEDAVGGQFGRAELRRIYQSQATDNQDDIWENLDDFS